MFDIRYYHALSWVSGTRMLFKASLTTLFCLVFCQSCAALSAQCSSGWKVTGYYTPVEDDYQGQKRQINVQGMGALAFNADFLRDVQMEGWGKTQQGWYLGYYGRQWHKSAEPLDASGRSLVVGIAATDPSHLASGLQFYVQSQTDFLNGKTFVARDVGQKVKNKHIDIYTGEGTPAKHETWNVTGKNTICYL